MARTSKQTRRPTTGSQRAAAARPGSAGARARQAPPQRRKKKGGFSANRAGWLSVGLVVLALAALIVYKTTDHSTTPTSANGVATGQHPAAASPAVVAELTSIPASVFNAVGTGSQPAAFTVTAKQPVLTSKGLPEFVYYGAEFCPYCAMMRWPLIVALSRFGTFTNLKQTSSASDDSDVPTFSFLGSSYKSDYLTFSPWESRDRQNNDGQPLQTVPNSINDLYTTYDGSASGAASKFDQAAGIPFLDIANKYVSAGTQEDWATDILPALKDGGPGWLSIAQGLHNPSSALGVSISAKLLIAQANYISAAICSVAKNAPASVCSSSGVTAAAKVLAAAKPVS